MHLYISLQNSSNILLYPDVFDVFGILWLFDRRNNFVNRKRNLPRCCGVKMDLYRCRIDVARRLVPLLALAPVHWQLYGLPGFKVKDFMQRSIQIDLMRDQCLHEKFVPANKKVKR